MIKARLLGRRTTGFLSVSPKSGSPLQGITNQKLNFRTFLQDRILFCLFWEVEQFCSTGMHGASQFCTEVSTESNWGVRCTSPPCFAPQWRSRATFANWLLFSCCCCSYCTLLSGATLGSAEGVPQSIQIQKYGLANLNISCHALEIDVLFLWGGLEAFYISGTWINISIFPARFVVAHG